ncbi:MAG: hypothetical protein ACRDLQ_06115 [Solirubrobacterales bacterium]
MIAAVRALTIAVLSAAMLACLGPAASADHTLEDLVSPDGAAQFDWDALHMSPDGQRVLFGTSDPFDPADTDTRADIYEVVGETFTRVGPGGGFCCVPRAFSLDGSHVFFQPVETDDFDDKLVPEDRDITDDVYETHAGVTRLVSVGSLPSNGLFDATLRDTPDDGSRAYFTTEEQLVAQDTDGGYIDIYERSPSGTRLVSTGGNGEFDVAFRRASDVGAVVVFATAEQLVAADTDTQDDLYANSGAGTELVSTGPTSGGGGGTGVNALSPTGSRVVFSTRERLVPEDTDGSGLDVYARAAGTTELVSTGPTSTNAAADVTFHDASEDATVVLFSTTEQLTADHTWADIGYYRRAGATTDLIVPVDVNRAFPVTSGDGSRAFYDTHTKVLPEDTDPNLDIYQWHQGVTTRLSTGPQDTDWANPFLGGASFDGERVFFITKARHLPEDPSPDWDVYERFQGQTKLLTAKPSPQLGLGISIAAVSPDGTQVLIETGQALDPADTDANEMDAYLYTAPSAATSFGQVGRVDDFARSAP